MDDALAVDAGDASGVVDDAAVDALGLAVEGEFTTTAWLSALILG
jgi:hypothetical protein